MKTNFHLLLIASVFTLLLASCTTDPQSPGRIFVPDMTYSQAYETYTTNPNFENGQTARVPAKGTISRGTLPASSDNESGHLSALHKTYFPNTNEGYLEAGAKLKNPLVLNDVALDKGKALYTVYCAVCHGDEGAGDGTIVKNGKYPPVPSYADRLPTVSQGQMYHSITWGKNLMGGYASQINAEERWQLVYYIQKLGKVGAFAENIVVADSTVNATAATK
jgi:mono/diheme cytochrome c family protein